MCFVWWVPYRGKTIDVSSDTFDKFHKILNIRTPNLWRLHGRARTGWSLEGWSPSTLSVAFHWICTCTWWNLAIFLICIHSRVSHHFRKSAMENHIPAEVLETPLPPIDFQRKYAAYLTTTHNDARSSSASLKKLHLRIQRMSFMHNCWCVLHITRRIVVAYPSRW